MSQVKYSPAEKSMLDNWDQTAIDVSHSQSRFIPKTHSPNTTTQNPNTFIQIEILKRPISRQIFYHKIIWLEKLTSNYIDEFNKNITQWSQMRRNLSIRLPERLRLLKSIILCGHHPRYLPNFSFPRVTKFNINDIPSFQTDRHAPQPLQTLIFMKNIVTQLFRAPTRKQSISIWRKYFNHRQKITINFSPRLKIQSLAISAFRSISPATWQPRLSTQLD